MKKGKVNVYASAGAAVLLLAGCHGKGNNGFPEGFENYPDAAKVDYMMGQTTPDSVARFICDAALGKVPGAPIDSISAATLQAYEKYRGAEFDKFSETFDEYSLSKPLPEKMKLLFMAGTEDPVQLGYQLGLEYVNQIRTQHKTAEQVETEIKEFRKACGNDKETYDRFITGFHIALKEDHGKDLPEEIYRRFINYN